MPGISSAKTRFCSGFASLAMTENQHVVSNERDGTKGRGEIGVRLRHAARSYF